MASIVAEARAWESRIPLPCETENDREFGRTATVTGIPIRSSPVTLPTRVMPICCAMRATRARVFSGVVVRCVPRLYNLTTAGPKRTSARLATRCRCTADACDLRKKLSVRADHLPFSFLSDGREGGGCWAVFQPQPLPLAPPLATIIEPTGRVTDCPSDTSSRKSFLK